MDHALGVGSCLTVLTDSLVGRLWALLPTHQRDAIVYRPVPLYFV